MLKLCQAELAVDDHTNHTGTLHHDYAQRINEFVPTRTLEVSFILEVLASGGVALMKDPISKIQLSSQAGMAWHGRLEAMSLHKASSRNALILRRTIDCTVRVGQNTADPGVHEKPVAKQFATICCSCEQFRIS